MSIGGSLNLAWLITCLVMTVAAMLSACAAGNGVRYIDIVDSDGDAINSVCVLPLYKKVTGLGYGPDAVGSKIIPNAYMIGPYRFVSGENIITEIERGKRRVAALPFVVSMGESLSYVRLLVLKGGYEPALLRRSDVYGSTEIVMQKSSAEGVKRIISCIIQNTEVCGVILNTAYDMQDNILIDYSHDDLLLLRSCTN